MHLSFDGLLKGKLCACFALAEVNRFGCVFGARPACGGWFGYLGTLHEVPGSSVRFRINWLRSGDACVLQNLKFHPNKPHTASAKKHLSVLLG